MPSVVQRKRVLIERPPVAPIPGVSLRSFAGNDDIEQWLALRDRAFARQKVGVRRWDVADFRREFLEKSWWRPEWMWLAETHESPNAQLIGTATLALRQSETATIPVVHWLCVLPSWRRRGVGRLLMTVVEQAAWDAGYREVALETHEAWREAAACYEALGYAVVSPRVAR
jgi:GNAT superfamily N-acetyltransferase